MAIVGLVQSATRETWMRGRRTVSAAGGGGRGHGGRGGGAHRTRVQAAETKKARAGLLARAAWGLSRELARAQVKEQRRALLDVELLTGATAVLLVLLAEATAERVTRERQGARDTAQRTGDAGESAG